MSDSTELRHLESEAALRARIHAVSGRNPNAGQTSYAASCLLHGRLYWESAKDAPIETRPLLLYYGAASFAKALVMAKNCLLVSDIATGHGISCSLGDGNQVGTYVAKSNGFGLFQQFNDVVANLSRVHYYEGSTSRYHYVRSSLAVEHQAFRTTLQEILARVPEVSKTYELCVGQSAPLLHFQFNAPFDVHDTYEIRVDLAKRFAGRDKLALHIQKIRARAPFLSSWRVTRATHAWDNSIVNFRNYQGAPVHDEISLLVQSNDAQDFEASADLYLMPQFDALASLPTVAGGYGHRPTYVGAYGDQCLSEYSTLLIGLLALSSLVRYQPHIWTSCVHRRRLAGHEIDDTLLPVVEAFLNHCTIAFPKLITDVLLAN